MQAELLEVKKDFKSSHLTTMRLVDLSMRRGRILGKGVLQQKFYENALELLNNEIKNQEEVEGSFSLGFRYLQTYIKKYQVLMEMEKKEEALACLNEAVEKIGDREETLDLVFESANEYINSGELEKGQQYFEIWEKLQEKIEDIL
jgi:tetratricopeptide (TPR) repeat protein